MNRYQAGLILEGGGMKGVYTAGVLDYFMKHEVEFSSCYGVSAGACQLCNYMSKQYKRSYRVFMNYLDDPEYFGWKSLLLTGDIFGAKMCYDTVPNELDLFDYDTANAYPGKCYAVITDVNTAKPVYYPMIDLRKDMIGVRASSSLPLVSKNVIIDGVPYLDGGISDSIPLLKSIEDQNKKHVLILTKASDYRKKESSHMRLLKIKYRAFPELVKAMQERHVHYNHVMDLIEEYERDGKIFVIRPQNQNPVSRLERDKEKLKALYLEGYHDAKRSFKQMTQYLEKE